MPSEFFIRRGEKVAGPKSGRDIKRLVVRSRIVGSDSISTSQSGPWTFVRDVPQLAAVIADQEHQQDRPAAATIDAPPVERAAKVDERASEAEQMPVGPGFAQRIAHRSRQVIDTALSEGKQRVVDAFAEAMSRVDESETLLLSDRLVLGRGSQQVDKVLPHPQVSLRHAVVEKNLDGAQITDLGSDSGTFVGGERVHRTTTLRPGDTISIGPYTLAFDGENLVSESTIDNAELLCCDLTKVVTDRGTGQQKTILNGVTLIANPREFLVLLGPSGSGKSTLLNALSARSLATSGDVVLNGRNLYANFDALKKNISLVPQKDVLHENLRLQNALLYTARLRLPPDLRPSEIKQITDDYLDAVDLGDRGGTYIRSLSGGQIKRASVANEIISQPNLLFIDEATSGLDEHTDGEIMQIFRRIAEEGKTVVCITHNLTNVEKHCHKVAILASGGYLAFVGTPGQAREYFGIDSLGEIYARLKDCSGDEWRDRFAATEVCREMVATVEETMGTKRPDITRTATPSRLQHLGNFARQTAILLRRGVELQWADRKSLAMLTGQCLFVAVLIGLLFGDVSLDSQTYFGESQRDTTAIVFLLSISSFWFGCNNAAKEIVKEQAIYERERAVCLNLFSYYCSKLILLVGLTSAQIVTLLGVVSLLTGLPGSAASYGFALLITGLCGVSLGLFISTLAPSTDVAATAVPIAVIPQVILAGMISPVSGIAKLLACVFVTCYWSFGSVVASMPDDIVSRSRPESLAEQSYVFSIGVMIVHAGALMAGSIVYLYAKDKRWMPEAAELDAWVKASAEAVANRTLKIREQLGGG